MTSDGNTPIELRPNIALRAFAFHGPVVGAVDAFTAYLELPNALVEITATSADELESIISVVESWAKE